MTVPDGAPAPGATEATEAVTVVNCPTTVGSGDDTTAVVVAALPTA
ncbi:hypothetical protein [Streptomyces sp. NEAU-L66]